MNQVYFAPWEQEFEDKGPLTEQVKLPGHQCISLPQKDSLHFWQTSRDLNIPIGAYMVWDVLEPILMNKKTIIDMGGGDRPVQGSINWDLLEGKDIVDIEELAGINANLIVSSHSIEHVPSEKVPQMLRDWHSLLAEDGELFISGPHRCSLMWSVFYGSPHNSDHKWNPTASCIGNFLVRECGMRIVSANTHVCFMDHWFVHLKCP